MLEGVGEGRERETDRQKEGGKGERERLIRYYTDYTDSHPHLDCVHVSVGISVDVRVLYLDGYHLLSVSQHSPVALSEGGSPQRLWTQL